MAYGTNAPFGLKPFNSITGAGYWTSKLNKYNIGCNAAGATYKQNIFQNDPLGFNTTGADIGRGTIAPLVLAMAGGGNNTGFPLGVFQGCEYFDTAGNFQTSNHWVGGTPILPGSRVKALVIDDPMAVFDVQASTSGNQLSDTQFWQDEIGTNVNCAVAVGGVANNPGTGSLMTGISGYYADGETNDNTSTRHLKIIGITPNPNNRYDPIPLVLADALSYVNLLVVFNVHIYKSVGVLQTATS